ncbi:MAG TPA: serine/threonine-protein kinase [Gemmataceae bacterium]|nr:serine/threonine-protein kinase [Gemmataceae bacterium]
MNAVPDQPPTEDDPRLLRAVQEYLGELEAGRRPDRGEFAERFPDLVEAAAPYLDALDMVHAAAPLLYPSAEGRPAPAAAESIPAEPLGDFHIIREVGRGGMGVVYEAIQLSLGRRVALKVLPFAATLDPRQLQRFHNEARAAASLHHPNIVPVYAVGCERGVHFYAMQLIEGQNFAAVIQDLRKAGRGPAGDIPVRPGQESTGPYPSPPPSASAPAAATRPSVSITLSTQRSGRSTDFYRTVARLTAQAAEALDYAHGLGIIHRDVKPANLLVEGRGNVWVTDFGLAQFHADAGLTATGDLLGTLRYMSPEQAGGQRSLLDHRTDVYSLGATLYELLTLRPIFDGTDRQALLQQIMHEEPRPPRAIDRSIPPELETIVLKAIAKAPEERYATAREFADDLQRFLRDEPVLARRPTLAQRARKWARRHPSVIAAGVVLLVLVTVGSLISAGLVSAEQRNTRLEQQKTKQALEDAERRAREAEERYQLALRSVDEMVQVSEEELAGQWGMELVRKRLLLSALGYYQDLIEQRRDDPETQGRLAAAQERVQKVLNDLKENQVNFQMRLLRDAAVRDDLRLTTEQRARLDELHRVLERRPERSASDGDRQRFFEEVRTAVQAIRKVPTEKQAHRLQQIDLQLQGPHAFRDPEVARALKLTAWQKGRIRKIEGETFFFGQPDSDNPWMTHEERLKAARERIQALLTPEQKKQWDEMTGEPFQGLARPFPAFGPFGRPPPGGPKGPGGPNGPGGRLRGPDGPGSPGP